MPDMEDSYTLTEYSEDFKGMPDIASHIQTLQHEPGPTGPDHQICGLSEPKSQHIHTLYLLSHCSPVIFCTPTQPAGCYDLPGKGT